MDLIPLVTTSSRTERPKEEPRVPSQTCNAENAEFFEEILIAGVVREADGYFRCTNQFDAHDLRFIECENCKLLAEFKFPKKQELWKGKQNKKSAALVAEDDFFSANGDAEQPFPNDEDFQPKEKKSTALNKNPFAGNITITEATKALEAPNENDDIFQFLGQLNDEDSFLDHEESLISSSMFAKRPMQGPDLSAEVMHFKPLKKLLTNPTKSSTTFFISPEL